MAIASSRPNRIRTLLVASGVGSCALILYGAPAQSTEQSAALKSFKVVVNSDRDEIIADQHLTLREAIGIVNNTLAWEDLSPPEQQQVKQVAQPNASAIEFETPSPVTIQLTQTLPPLMSPGLIIDGTSHPSYDPNHYTTAEVAVPVPTVSLTPAPGKSVFRGLTIAGDRITIQGLSIYGFNQPHFPTDTVPGADIVVSSQLPTNEAGLTSHLKSQVPNQAKIIDNWLGLPPNETLKTIPSGFGVWVFDGTNTQIHNNRIYHHGGSAILTSSEVPGLQIKQNLIVGNGLKGMPHAVYLEGEIGDGEVSDNLFCGNDGSAIYLFKTQGALKIHRNTMKFNGRRVPSAAVYLMGQGHQVFNNDISEQRGTGVTIAAYPRSERNLIEENSFTNLGGLSIDLNTRHHTNKPFFKLGDGINLPRDTGNRRRDTANRAINSPEFLSEDFYLIDGQVTIDGLADPDSHIALYQVTPSIFAPPEKLAPLAIQSQHYGPLSRHLTTTTADSNGRFSFTRKDLAPGTIISAIATKPEDGTSEPAFNAVIKSLSGTTEDIKPTITIPSCTTKPAPPEPPPEISQVTPPKPVILRVPTNIHFALDRSEVSPQSQQVLRQIASVLEKYPFLTIEIQGHTDSRASDQYNQKLSQRRAIAARNYLVQQGLDTARMSIVSWGESQLKRSGNSTLEHAYNRRVEIVFRDVRGLEIILEEQSQDLQLEP